MRHAFPPKILSFFAVIGFFLASAPPAMAKAYIGETYKCLFPRAGKVILDTREPGASITHKGQRHPASSGSYFYQTDGSDISLAFNPSMTRWTLTLWSGKEPISEKTTRCTRIKNRR
ncbi:MAG: hypothetical protein ACRCY3_03855 [Sphingorhabdus sp.]